MKYFPYSCVFLELSFINPFGAFEAFDRTFFVLPMISFSNRFLVQLSFCCSVEASLPIKPTAIGEFSSLVGEFSIKTDKTEVKIGLNLVLCFVNIFTSLVNFSKFYLLKKFNFHRKAQ